MSLIMPERDVHVQIQLDANRINARGQLATINQLERWDDDEVILLSLSEVAQNEARSGGDSRRNIKALGYVYSMTLAKTDEEPQRLRTIAEILAGGRTPDTNTLRDAEIVFNAAKYGTILVTADKGILTQRDVLSAKFGVRIMTEEEAVTHVREKIRLRDEEARFVAHQTRELLPAWVGND